MTTADAVSIVRMGTDLLVPLHGDLEDSSVERIERDVTQMVADTKATGVLVDVSGLAVVDSYVARVIARLAATIKLLGVQSAVVGIQPAVAIALVELGATDEGCGRAELVATEMATNLIEHTDRGGWILTRPLPPAALPT